MPFRDERQAQRARIEALESEVAELREERDRVLAERDEKEEERNEDLLDEATAERAEELAKAKAAEEAQRRRRLTHGTTERWIVAWNLRRTFHTFLSVFAGIGALALTAMGSALARPGPILPGERLVMQIVLVVSVVCAIGSSVWLTRSLLWLRSFRAKLPFVLDPAGWASLVDKEHFWISEMWWHVALAIEGGKKADVVPALDRFCGRANATFYGAEEPSSDERIRWQRKGGKARGSANLRTAYELAKFCAEDLTLIASQGRGVKRVTLTVSENSVHVSRPSSD